jgi:hypothetical protein
VLLPWKLALPFKVWRTGKGGIVALPLLEFGISSEALLCIHAAIGRKIASGKISGGTM